MECQRRRCREGTKASPNLARCNEVSANMKSGNSFTAAAADPLCESAHGLLLLQIPPPSAGGREEGGRSKGGGEIASL